MTVSSATDSRETHLSRLFFSPDRVYKLLKPVTLPFVDFSDSKVRCDAATHEFERNQAISPDVYLGLADVCEGGDVVDRMIVMRRLSADQELRQLLNKGNDVELIKMVARHVAGMHSNLEPLTGDAAAPATLDAISTNWEDNFEAIKPHVGPVIEPNEFHEVASLARAYMSGRESLFASRIDDGWVRDGHGDLRAEHIYCTPEGPRIIDCVAFDDRLRISDALADVAFLAMDLDRLVGPHAAIALMQAWNEFTNEHHPSSLAHFYVAYRAHVRCKIALFRHAQGVTGATMTAKRYHQQTLTHLRLARIRLVLVGGGPGSGKSTIAEGVSLHTGAAWLRADEIRKDVAGVGHDTHAFAEPGEGIYSPEVNEKVQREIMRQTKVLLGSGSSVVLDSTWRSSNDRAAVRELGSQSAAKVTELQCVLPPAIAKERIARRMASVYNPSDATPELVDYMADRFDEWPEATIVDTGTTAVEGIRAACAAISPITTSPAAAPNVDEPEPRFVIDLTALRNLMMINGGIGEPG